jgi:hypothetical protein
LFWDHFSERVRQAVALEGAPNRASRWEQWLRPRVVLPMSVAALAAVLIVAVLVTPPDVAPATPEVATTLGAWTSGPPAFESLDSSGDASLNLVADLTAELDWEAASRMELTTHAGGADEAVRELTGGELRELQRLLKEELARAGV